MTRDQFERRIHEIWGKCFALSPDTFQQQGTTVIEYDRIKGTGGLHLYHIGVHAVLRYDGDRTDPITRMVEAIQRDKGTSYALTADDILSLQGYSITHDHTERIHYLHPDDYQPHFPSGFQLRSLSADDQPALDVMKATCTEYEVDDGWVSADDDYAVGLFDGDTLIACASMYDWQGFADPGVLVHPDYRGHGLGKVAVSAVCDRVLQQGMIMDYRCDVINVASGKLAQRLGFTPWYRIDVFEFS